VTINSANENVIDVTIVNPSEQQYLVVMLQGTSESEPPTEKNILYIDQGAKDSSGNLTFQVYPKSIQNSVILIYGADGTTIKAAIVDAKFVLGDANGDGEFDIRDVTELLRYLVNLSTVSSFNVQAADVDGVSGVDVRDVTKMLRVLVNLDTL
jgi:hypothetical protein